MPRARPASSERSRSRKLTHSVSCPAQAGHPVIAGTAASERSCRISASTMTGITMLDVQWGSRLDLLPLPLGEGWGEGLRFLDSSVTPSPQPSPQPGRARAPTSFRHTRLLLNPLYP